MNQELMKTVERVVRPLPCDKTRKNRIRADLYGQLERIFEEELAKDGSPALALARTQERFGETAQLQQELRGTIPRLHQWQATLDQWITHRREGQSTLRFATEFSLRTAGMLLLFFVVMVAWGTFYWQDPIIWRIWPTFLAIAVLMGVNCFTHIHLGELALGAFQVESAHFRLKRPLWLIAASVGAGLSLAVSLFVLIETASAGAYWSGLPGVFFLPMLFAIVLFLLVIWLMAKVELEDRQWSQLCLD